MAAARILIHDVQSDPQYEWVVAELIGEEEGVPIYELMTCGYLDWAIAKAKEPSEA